MAQYKLHGRKALSLENLRTKQSLSIMTAGKEKSLSLETVMTAIRALLLLHNILDIQATGLVFYLMEQLSRSLPSSDLI